MFGKHTKSHIIEVSSSHQYDKWCKVVVLSREYENISKMSYKNIYNEFKQYRWYEIITYNSKQIQIFSRTLEIGGPV